MFKVKICGIRSLEDLAAVTAAGADAIGLNFYASSKRYVPFEAARTISRAAGTKLWRVGLFVNADPEFVRKMYEAIPLDAVQAHGTEDSAWFAAVKQFPMPIIRAIRCPKTKDELKAEIERVPQYPELYDALLIDGTAAGPSPGSPIFGGSGAVANWEAIRAVRDSITLPLILAGGLTPANVLEAIESAVPNGVDVAGGVEGNNGEKDATKVASFTAAARAALDREQQ
jgi:phosphoribosylanthranilate isomerase